MAQQIPVVYETQLPGEPDIGALSQMQDPILMVYKVTRGEKNRENVQLVINSATGMSMQDILKLQDELPLGRIQNSGPGVYRFSVTDQNSAAKTSWQCRLGGAVVDNPLPGTPAAAAAAALPFGALPTAGAVHPVPPGVPLVAGVPPSATARPIGNGFYYDESLGLLTAPDGSIHAWRKGQPLPGLTTSSTGASTPASAFAGPGLSFFGPSPELESTKAALAQAQRALETIQQQREQERTEAAHRQELAELRESLKELGQKLAEPRENSELVELKRRLEARDQFEALRAESKAQIDAIMALVREQSMNRGIDPMVTMLTTIMQQQQQSSAETLRMMRETATGERQTLMTVLDRQVATAERTAANNPFEKLASGFDVLMERMGRILQLERDMSGGGGGFDWGAIIKETIGKAGSALQVYQSAKVAEARTAEVNARAAIAKAQAQVTHDRALVAMRGGRAAPPATPAATPMPPVATPQPNLDLEKATTTELRAIFGKEPDAAFFGGFFEHVGQLRTAVTAAPTEFSAEKIAALLMQAREFVAQESQEGRTPHAAELWAYGQVEYLIERLLPEASEGLRHEVRKALLRMQAEADDAERVAANNRLATEAEVVEEGAAEEEEVEEEAPAAEEVP